VLLSAGIQGRDQIPTSTTSIIRRSDGGAPDGNSAGSAASSAGQVINLFEGNRNEKHPFILRTVAAVVRGGMFTLGWAPVEGEYESPEGHRLRLGAGALPMEQTSVELSEDYIVNPDT
jgi:hypothetical protein